MQSWSKLKKTCIEVSVHKGCEKHQQTPSISIICPRARRAFTLFIRVLSVLIDHYHLLCSPQLQWENRAPASAVSQGEKFHWFVIANSIQWSVFSVLDFGFCVLSSIGSNHLWICGQKKLSIQILIDSIDLRFAVGNRDQFYELKSWRVEELKS